LFVILYDLYMGTTATGLVVASIHPEPRVEVSEFLSADRLPEYEGDLPPEVIKNALGPIFIQFVSARITRELYQEAGVLDCYRGEANTDEPETLARGAALVLNQIAPISHPSRGALWPERYDEALAVAREDEFAQRQCAEIVDWAEWVNTEAMLVVNAAIVASGRRGYCIFD
jgi:hypothetical protein